MRWPRLSACCLDYFGVKGPLTHFTLLTVSLFLAGRGTALFFGGGKSLQAGAEKYRERELSVARLFFEV